jgi:alpha-L-fucosidase 2
MAWKINFWARLHDGEHAYKLLCDLLSPAIGYDGEGNRTDGGGTAPNLLCMHPPFQIDGNLGACAGIAEMLLQCRAERIEVLPAIPPSWREGSFRGLVAPGGAEVSAAWKDGALVEVGLHAHTPYSYRIKLPAGTSDLHITINGTPASLPVVGGMLVVSLLEGDVLSVRI